MRSNFAISPRNQPEVRNGAQFLLQGASSFTHYLSVPDSPKGRNNIYTSSCVFNGFKFIFYPFIFER